MVHNANEGDAFVPDEFDSLYTPATYSAEVFPELDNPEEVAGVYESVGDNVEQLRKAFGEGVKLLEYVNVGSIADVVNCSFSALLICAAYKILPAFEGRAYKVNIFLNKCTLLHLTMLDNTGRIYRTPRSSRI